ncbi:MAG: hypothetical protein M4579_006569 [Chaenotheca gracillima]|nr:MAG: hypothetical protein M4579_006569 [Chaenotheca gracillima]
MAYNFNGAGFPAGPFWDFVSNLDSNVNRGEGPTSRSRPRQHHRQGGRPSCQSSGPAGANPFLEQLFSQFAGVNPEGAAAASSPSDSNRPFTPPLDLFSTPQAYILHLSLPGAKRSDIGLNYNADTTELSVSGVVHRPGDEEFLKTLVNARGERQTEVGLFERKVKLGELPGRTSTEAEQQEGGEVDIDSDGITAKLEDGLLVVTVPKVEKFVEIKKVDIE